MPEYRIGGQNVRRKNWYRPCIMVEEFDKAEADGDHATLARMLKATVWADNIANSEWPVVLHEEEAKPYNRSRLKKKAAGWIMALQRIARLHPELFEEIADLAQRTYQEQIQEEPPVVLVWHGQRFVPNEFTEVQERIVDNRSVGYRPPVADPAQADED